MSAPDGLLPVPPLPLGPSTMMVPTPQLQQQQAHQQLQQTQHQLPPSGASVVDLLLADFKNPPQPSQQQQQAATMSPPPGFADSGRARDAPAAGPSPATPGLSLLAEMNIVSALTGVSAFLGPTAAVPQQQPLPPPPISTAAASGVAVTAAASAPAAAGSPGPLSATIPSSSSSAAAAAANGPPTAQVAPAPVPVHRPRPIGAERHAGLRRVASSLTTGVGADLAVAGGVGSGGILDGMLPAPASAGVVAADFDFFGHLAQQQHAQQQQALQQQGQPMMAHGPFPLQMPPHVVNPGLLHHHQHFAFAQQQQQVLHFQQHQQHQQSGAPPPLALNSLNLHMHLPPMHPGNAARGNATAGPPSLQQTQQQQQQPTSPPPLQAAQKRSSWI
ncbi:hypothetical protein HK405_000134, partial [Cladochytrium tenue]